MSRGRACCVVENARRDGEVAVTSPLAHTCAAIRFDSLSPGRRGVCVYVFSSSCLFSPDDSRFGSSVVVHYQANSTARNEQANPAALSTEEGGRADVSRPLGLWILRSFAPSHRLTYYAVPG